MNEDSTPKSTDFRRYDGAPDEDLLRAYAQKGDLVDVCVADRAFYMAGRLDALLTEAITTVLNAVLHHPKFQQLEAAWRGLQYLIDVEADYDEDLRTKIKVLNLSWKDLGKDLTRSIEFDQSHIFQRIYSDEFDMAGGEPFGLLVGNYAVSHRATPGQPFSDIEVLDNMSDVAAAAFCPFVVAAKPSLFGLDSFADLNYPLDLSTIFSQAEYTNWRQLRDKESSRFIGVLLPEIRLRRGYRAGGERSAPSEFYETVDGSADTYLWGHPGFAFGSVVVRAFANTSWFADIRGGTHEFGEGGVVTGLSYEPCLTGRYKVTEQAATRTMIDDRQERVLAQLGFIPLCSYQDIERSVFYSNNSLHRPPDYRQKSAQVNASMSAMLQYMLCVSRFAHYVKIIGRDKIGTFTGPEDCQRILQNWLNQYTIDSDSESSELRARYPLSSSKVDVKNKVGSPGCFTCVIHLQPHFQLDQLVSSIRLVTELTGGETLDMAVNPAMRVM